MKCVLIGAGNVATSLAISLHKAGHTVAQVYSRTVESAAELAGRVDAQAIDQLEDIVPTADLYICSLKDDVLPTVIPQLPCLNGVVVHTAGAMPMGLFEGSKVERYGVLYPFQTFSKQVVVPFAEVPLFIEGSDVEVEKKLQTVAQSMQAKHWTLSSDDRKWLHLAGVFACNFTNLMFAKAEGILAQAGLPFETILPLIRETVRKVETHRPEEVQTGPAVREDRNVMKRHLSLLSSTDDRAIYTLLSEEIIKLNKE